MTVALIILTYFAQLFSTGLVLFFHQQFEVGQFKCVGIPLQASNGDAESRSESTIRNVTAMLPSSAGNPLSWFCVRQPPRQQCL